MSVVKSRSKLIFSAFIALMVLIFVVAYFNRSSLRERLEQLTDAGPSSVPSSMSDGSVSDHTPLSVDNNPVSAPPAVKETPTEKPAAQTRVQSPEKTSPEPEIVGHSTAPIKYPKNVAEHRPSSVHKGTTAPVVRSKPASRLSADKTHTGKSWLERKKERSNEDQAPFRHLTQEKMLEFGFVIAIPMLTLFASLIADRIMRSHRQKARPLHVHRHHRDEMDFHPMHGLSHHYDVTRNKRSTSSEHAPYHRL